MYEQVIPFSAHRFFDVGHQRVMADIMLWQIIFGDNNCVCVPFPTVGMCYYFSSTSF